MDCRQNLILQAISRNLSKFPILIPDGVGEEGERQGGRRPGSLIWKTAEETVRDAGTHR